MSNIVRFVFVNLLMLLLVGCSNKVYNPSDHYDPNALEELGVILGKTPNGLFTEQDVENLCPTKSGKVAGELVSGVVNYLVFGIIYFDGGVGSCSPREVTMYKYTINLISGRSVIFYSSDGGWVVGQCVKMFFSNMKSYPRITFGSGCVEMKN